MKAYVKDTTYREDTGSFISPNKQQIILTQGQRGSGKSTLNELIGESLYKCGWTVLDLWASDNLENLFWCVNQNCKSKHEEWMITHPDEKEEIHCSCSARYPILVLCPDYVQWDQKALDAYNEIYYTKKEWVEKLRKQGEVLIEYDRTNPPKKPEMELQKPWIKIKYLPKPSRAEKTATNELIVKKISEAIVEARAERRIVVFNPKLFPVEFDKFKTLELIIRSLGDITFNYFKPLTEKDVGRPRSEWSNEQKCWHRMVVIFRELGELTASVLKGENESTITKKAILNFIRKSRHYNISLISDYQRGEDCFPGVRDQANIFILKRAPKRLFGEEWGWAFEYIMDERQKIFDKMGYNLVSYSRANQKFPKIEELNMNRAYVVYSNDKMRLWQLPPPNFHHKKPEDHFEQVTGVSFKILHLGQNTESQSSDNGNSANAEGDEKILYSVIFQLRNQQNGKSMNWKDIIGYLTQEQEKGNIRWKTQLKQMQPNTISKWYARINRKHTHQKN